LERAIRRAAAIVRAGDRFGLARLWLVRQAQKVATHRIAWHAQVLREFLARVEPAPVALHAPRVMAPLLTQLTLPIHWIDATELPAALRDAPYPDRGHLAGPRALRTLLASPEAT